MNSYALWNNKGGVGKSFLCFSIASEFAAENPDHDVYVIDMCPQANVTETFLGGYDKSPNAIKKLTEKKPRATVAGYLEARLNSPFQMISDVSPYVTQVKAWNPNLGSNIYLIAGDNLLEIQSEAIRQTSQLPIPKDAWYKILSWLRDLVNALEKRSGSRQTRVFIDCNPSFAIYTQLALAAADFVIVPFTADDSSRRAIENVAVLLYGEGTKESDTYARIDFSARAREENLAIPKLHTFVSNRQTLFEGRPSKAFQAANKAIKSTADAIFLRNKTIFADTTAKPSSYFIEVPDNHGASVVSAVTGTPLNKLTPGPKVINGERVQLNKDPLDKYKKALKLLVARF